MRRLLYVSIPLLMIGCDASEGSVQAENGQDSTVVISDTSLTIVDSLTIDLPLPDSGYPIIHGNPDQAKLDSIKKAKGDKKNKD
tara:strand:+ start:1699 stop:1950 length:252 start_codon:yes stop_codon:yes gene_type:complete